MILQETLAELRARGELDGRAVRAVYPTGYFAVVELDDGSVGAGMSYYRSRTGPAAEEQRTRIEDIRKSDPLLIHWLFEDADPWIRVGREGEDGRRFIWSLQTALLSALSARRLASGGDDTFAAIPFPAEVFASARRALVIGFGGYMNSFARSEHITHLHVCDLYYASRLTEMESYADRYRRPGLQFTFSDGREAGLRMREADIVAITGSALCNGTLDGLLEMVRGGPWVVVQGVSAGI